MDSLIPVVNRLQDVVHAVGEAPFELPTIAVVGSQSSGKSSVVEAIVGRDFLPRGVGVVTRRPLVLHLYHRPDADYAVFGHTDKTFTDFAAVRQEILDETARIAGPDKNISSKPIVLKIYSPRVLNLTLVDLPGLTKIPIGDQPTTIERQIKQLCLEYISNPSCIILAVTAANTDIANSDALKLSRAVDPEGGRTLGVLTKIDLMDAGTDALDILQGRIIPLRCGFVGVVNRSQQDILDSVSMDDARLHERMFFERHAAYRPIAARMGTPYLSKTLNTMLVQHIRKWLPDIKTRIGSMLATVKDELKTLGSPLEAQTPAQQRKALLGIIGRYASAYGGAIDGKGDADGAALHGKTELFGGARIAYIFGKSFTSRLEEMTPFDGLTDEEISTAIKNSTGAQGALFVPESSFQALVKRQIKQLEAPGLECVQFVFEELQRVAVECYSGELRQFERLRDASVEVVHSVLRNALGPTQTMISNLISIELAHINTNHPDFIGGARAVQETLERLQAEARLNPRLMDEDASSFGTPGDADSDTGTAPGSAAQTQFMSAFDRPDTAAPPAPFTTPSPPRPPRLPGSNGSAVGVGGGAGAGAGAGSGSGSGADATLRSYRDTNGHVPPSPLLHHGSSNGTSNGTGPAAAAAPPPSGLTLALTPRATASTVKLTPAPATLRTTPIDSMDRQDYIEMCIIKSLIASYFNIVRKNYLDLVPKTIMCFLVNHAKDNIQAELTEVLYTMTETTLEHMLEESTSVMAQRRSCHEMRTLLERALDIVNEVGSFA